MLIQVSFVFRSEQKMLNSLGHLVQHRLCTRSCTEVSVHKVLLDDTTYTDNLDIANCLSHQLVHVLGALFRGTECKDTQ